MSATSDDLAAQFTEWRIWRGRSYSGAAAEWHATWKLRKGRRPGRLTAADAEGLRSLLAQHEALEAVPA